MLVRYAEQAITDFQSFSGPSICKLRCERMRQYKERNLYFTISTLYIGCLNAFYISTACMSRVMQEDSFLQIGYRLSLPRKL